MKWNAKQYLQFEKERSRPAADLLAMVPLTHPRYIVDLGCGPGNSTELISWRYPQAEIVGVDSSHEMVLAAQKRLPRLRFIEADIADWQAEKPVDLIFGNAVFQWMPNHLEIFTRLIGTLAPDGLLAVQLPGNHLEPSHVLMRDLATDGPWSTKLATKRNIRTLVHSARDYYDQLKPVAAHVELWQTTYHHILDSAASIVEWMKGTGLGPYLAALDEAERVAYLAEYEWELAMAYPPLVDGRVLFPLPRLFLIVHAKGQKPPWY